VRDERSIDKKEDVMRCFYVSVICLLFPVLGLSATIHVPADQPTIQDGIDAAVTGDTVLVAPGTYVENIDFKGKAITVTSKMGPEVTIIDGNYAGSVVTFDSDEGPDTVLEGFTLTNGTGTSIGVNYYNGGGVRCLEASPKITGNIITGNSVNNKGGGISCSDHSYPSITGNIITKNSANNGGGIFSFWYSSPTITGNIIAKNSAINGGGIYGSDGSNLTIVNNTITENTAGDNGGGVCCTNNSSSAIWNNILWNNDAPEGPEIWIGSQSSPSTVHVGFSDVEGGQASVHVESNCTFNWGPGAINADPLFINMDDFHLTWYSPCKDTGDKSWVFDSFDIEGDPRIFYSTVDMGADEFYKHLYFTGNAVPGGDVELIFVDTPWTVVQGLILGVDIYDPPIPGAYGDWFIKPPMMFLIPIGLIPQSGILVFPGTIPITFPSDFTIYLQAMIGWKLTNLCVIYVQEPPPPPGMVIIPAGEFEMGDHFGVGNSDELPLHDVFIDSFYMDIYEVTNEKYCEYLTSAYSQGLIEVISGIVYKKGDTEPYCDTYSYDDNSRIHWDGSAFSITTGKEDHPMLLVSWYGAAAYANWLSTEEGRTPSYDLDTWECTFGAGGYRLPTEAEWEYAARGGNHNPYYKYPWGDTIDGSKANYQNSNDTYEGILPETTPVGYYDGNQTPSGVDMANGYGLYDMAGNIYEWCNDWYDGTYYQWCVDHGIYYNPKGPSSGISVFRVVRGGSWYNVVNYLRCAYRSSHFWYYPSSLYHYVGFRLALEMP